MELINTYFDPHQFNARQTARQATSLIFHIYLTDSHIPLYGKIHVNYENPSMSILFVTLLLIQCVNMMSCHTCNYESTFILEHPHFALEFQRLDRREQVLSESFASIQRVLLYNFPLIPTAKQTNGHRLYPGLLFVVWNEWSWVRNRTQRGNHQLKVLFN